MNLIFEGRHKKLDSYTKMMTRMNRRKKNKRYVFWLIVVLLFLAGFGTAQFLKRGQETKVVVPNDIREVSSQDSGKKDSNSSKGNGTVSNTKPTERKDQQTTEDKVNALIEKMTLSEKVGQMLMVGFYGKQEDDHIINLIREQKVGGVILFDRNMQSPRQVAELTNKLKQDAESNENSIPMMIGLDQEGGPVLRMRDQVSPIPSEQKLGQNASLEDVYDIAKLNGEELAAMGIQVDFAPVLDLSDQDERSFGSSPDKAARYGLEEVKGLNDSQVTATVKHFPGNGRVVVDPHLDESIVKVDKSTLENVDMVPFKQLIAQQKENQFFVMVTHVKYPAFDTEYPASISKIIIEDLLRKSLGFQGIVVTDDLDMGAVSKYYSYEQLGYMAVNAGADLLLVCHEYDHQVELYNGIIKAVQTGKLSEERINQSVKRILTYKLEHLTNKPVSITKADQVVRSPEHLEKIEKLK
ncbi:beta-N-acetylhexosaminidase [Bacillus sp. USDA818B3_A]|uniref:beta-N-acetylhexosaminidase n=1 Tax=Bacillus sp. USDA818B3_A TaxID=2698834 RepID=UPI001371DE79|nr:beta-N-acetylhexosaminidase [Bacillus sp. USDA818B3_A]